MKIQESAEDYLETIYLLQKRQGAVRSIDIAHELNYSKPSISNAMKKLRTEGFIDMENRGYITLTEKGKHLAEQTYARHCAIHKLLVQFGVDDETALKDACRMEHVISEETFQALIRFLDKNSDKTNDE